MLYNTAHFWRGADGLIWHSLSRFVKGGGTTDLTMGPVSRFNSETLQQREYRKLLEWCNSHRMTINDALAAAPAKEVRS